mmetsp:Transcript_16182/g.32805  ORF Transcript_16182/g.32805 Transcript_16182/m.32805 type:complete len:90 (+) Transcript_16182:1379-1648(+)
MSLYYGVLVVAILVGLSILFDESVCWTVLPGQHTYTRYAACLAQVKGRLVLLGGKKASGETSKPVEIWNPDTGGWTNMTVPPFDEIHRK